MSKLFGKTRLNPTADDANAAAETEAQREDAQHEHAEVEEGVEEEEQEEAEAAPAAPTRKSVVATPVKINKGKAVLVEPEPLAPRRLKAAGDHTITCPYSKVAVPPQGTPKKVPVSVWMQCQIDAGVLEEVED